jgi:LmbE family N-acetylglucosaminyl deacetylase
MNDSTSNLSEPAPSTDTSTAPRPNRFAQRLRKLDEPRRAERRAFVARVLECTDPIGLFFRGACLNGLRRCFKNVKEIDLRVRRGSLDVGCMTIRRLAEDVLKIVDTNIAYDLRDHRFGTQAVAILCRIARDEKYRSICGEMRLDTDLARRRKFWRSCGFQVDEAEYMSLDL